MNRATFAKFHRDCIEKMHEIVQKKNADYSSGQGEDNAFANFEAIEKIGIASTGQGFLTRMMDKMMRISSFVRKGELQVADETVIDTTLDLANYCILLAGYFNEQRMRKLKQEMGGGSRKK